MAAAIIAGAGLDAYYAEREAPAPRPTARAADWAAVPLTAGPHGTSECRLAIEGLRCASCVWVLEGVLQRTEGVEQALVSYATGRAVIRFDPARTTLPVVGARISALGYSPRPVDAAPQTDRDLLVRLGVSAFCAANVMLLSATVYTGWFEGMEDRFAALFRWTQLVLATPVALWSAAPFFAAAWRGVQNRILHMDLPISLAVGALYVHGLVATVWGLDGYLDSLTMLVTLLLVGRVLEARGRQSAAAAAASLAATLPTVARRVTERGVETVAVERLVVDDRVQVGIGEEVPADGRVVEGHAHVRMALLTGESEPVAVGPGDMVVAGAPVVDGTVTVHVERVGDETLGRRMASEVLASVDRGLPPTPADRIAPWFTAFTLGAAGLALLIWSMLAGVGTGIQVMVAVLVVACPCALGLSWPIAVSAGLSAIARRGLVLRNGASLLALPEVDLVALDKTGTITGGAPRVVAANNEVLRIAAGLERASRHPIAEAILHAASDRELPLPWATDLQETPGVGVAGTIDGTRWTLSAGGPGEVHLHSDSDPSFVGLIRLADTQRGDARQAVERLSTFGEVHLLTGDHAEVARAMGRTVGVTAVHAEMTPEHKAAWVREKRAEGRRVLFVGDGLNDGPALVAADVGLAMKAGATSTVLAADGIVVDDALAPVVGGLLGARVVRRTVRANMARSLSYNVVAVSLALAGWIDPLVAAVLMPLSSLLVLWGGLQVERRTKRMEAKWTSS